MATVLVVEDNALNAKLATTLLETWGHEAQVIADPRDLIEVTADAVLLDIELPGLDGLAFARQLREERGAGLPIIAVSGYATRQDRDAALAAGCDAFVPKPIDAELLRATLESMLAV